MFLGSFAVKMVLLPQYHISADCSCRTERKVWVPHPHIISQKVPHTVLNVLKNSWRTMFPPVKASFKGTNTQTYVHTQRRTFTHPSTHVHVYRDMACTVVHAHAYTHSLTHTDGSRKMWCSMLSAKQERGGWAVVGISFLASLLNQKPPETYGMCTHKISIAQLTPALCHMLKVLSDVCVCVFDCLHVL